MGIKSFVKKALTTSLVLSVGALSSSYVFAEDGSGGARGVGSSAKMHINASVPPNCTISTVDMNFGSYDPIVANATQPLTASSNLVVTCTKNAAVTVALDQGLNSNRTMKNSNGDSLSYRLLTQGGADFSSVNATGTGTAVTLPVNGVVPPAQNVPAGQFADTVIATVNF